MYAKALTSPIIIPQTELFVKTNEKCHFNKYFWH